MGLYFRFSEYKTPNFKSRFSFFHSLTFLVGMAWPCFSTLSQDATGLNSNPLPLRTNSQDVQLATLASSANTTPSDNGSSQDQWKSLTTSPSPESDPMFTPLPSPTITGTNAISSLVSESKPKPMLKKDDYGPQTGWGLRTSAGVALQQSISAGLFHGNLHQDIYFQPGFRWDIEPYYNIANGFSFGFEGGFIYNRVSSILFSGQNVNTASPQAGGLVYGGPTLGNGAFYQVPALLNMKFQIPNSGRLRGYCLGGVGGVWEYTTVSLSQTVTQIESTSVNGEITSLSTSYAYTPNTTSSHQWNFAFQLGAGFQYNLLPGLDLDTSFKTFITPNPLIFSDGTSQVKASYNYALEIGLAYRF